MCVQLYVNTHTHIQVQVHMDRARGALGLARGPGRRI